MSLSHWSASSVFSFAKKIPGENVTKTFSTLCKLCLRNSQLDGQKTETSWTLALCNVQSKSSNAEKFLIAEHKDEDTVKVYFTNKK